MIKQEAKREIHDRMARFSEAVGVRLASARLHNYEIYDDAQRPVVEDLRKLVGCVGEHIRQGGGLFLYGPTGTGKDHLACALLARAAYQGVRVERISGAAFFGKMTGSWGRDSCEDEVIEGLTRRKVLLISDPGLPDGLDAKQRARLYWLVDERSTRGKATWFTVNVASRAEAVSLLGDATFGRAIDNAVRCFCSWGNFRDRRKHKLPGNEPASDGG